MADNRIVITGGGGSGKSSLIEYFINNGYCAIREAAREQIRVGLELGNGALPWEDILAFSKNVQAQMLSDFNKFPDHSYCFYDRCLLDVLSYLHLDGREAYQELSEAIQEKRYFHTVFALPPWKEIFTKDDERMEDFEETVRAFETITETYKNNGYEIVEIPFGTIPQRAYFIFEELKKRGLDVTG